MNKSIHDIDLQQFQAPGSNRFTEATLANISERYLGGRINPTALYMAYFGTIPNSIRLEKIVCTKAQASLVDAFKQEINDVYFTKSPADQRDKIEYDHVYYIIYNDI